MCQQNSYMTLIGGTFDHVSHAPQLMSCNYMYIGLACLLSKPCTSLSLHFGQPQLPEHLALLPGGQGCGNLQYIEGGESLQSSTQLPVEPVLWALLNKGQYGVVVTLTGSLWPI